MIDKLKDIAGNHGWGSHSSDWDELLSALQEAFEAGEMSAMQSYTIKAAFEGGIRKERAFQKTFRTPGFGKSLFCTEEPFAKQQAEHFAHDMVTPLASARLTSLEAMARNCIRHGRKLAEKDTEDAERWRAFVSSERFRWIGSANFDFSKQPAEVTIKADFDPTTDHLHFGMEVWDRDPSVHSGDAEDELGRKVLNAYVDHMVARRAGQEDAR